MLKSKRTIILFILIVVALTLPTTALANKQIFKSRLTTSAELHEVVESHAQGSAVFGLTPKGVYFSLVVTGLSGTPTGAHIHGPASEAENAPVLVSLCGAPAPAAVASCELDENGNLVLQGVISSSLLARWGVNGPDLLDWLNNGLLYVNVHTALNPAGEARGQIYPQ